MALSGRCMTHASLAIVLVVAGFAVISEAAVTGVFRVLIGVFLWCSLHHNHGALAPEWRHAFVTAVIPCVVTTFVMI